MKNMFVRIQALLTLLLFTCTVNSRSQTVIPAEIPVSYDVSPTGAFTYSLPLEMPPGIKDMMPGLAISYNSQGGNGNLGKGWSLTGLSSITRTGNTIFHDQMLDPVDFDANDVFVLDGQRLIPIGSGVYMTEIKNFAKIESHNGTATSPDYFSVEQPNGVIYQYGNTPDSKMLAQGQSEILMWAINKIFDRSGNYIAFNYNTNQSNGEYYITSISYGHNSNVATTTPHTIEFSYINKTDPNVYHVSGSQVWVRKLLDKIEIKQNGTVVNTYQFTYETKLPNTSLDYFDHLVRIDETRPTNVHLPPIIINWGKLDVNHSTPQHDYRQVTLSQGAALYDYITGDFDADGATDIVSFPGVSNQSPYYVNINNKHNVFSRVSTGNINYNLPPGAGNDLPWQLTNYGANLKQRKLLLDYNGDGLEDMILTIADTTDPYNPKLVIEYYQSDGVHLNYNSTIYSHTMNEQGWTNFAYILPGDFDGNGKKEVMILQPRAFYSPLVLPAVFSSLKHLFKWYKFTTGYDVIITGADYPTNNGIPQAGNMVGSLDSQSKDVFVMDFDGDGRDDLCRTTLCVTSSNDRFEIYNIDATYTPPASVALTNPSNSLNQIYSSPGFTLYEALYNGDFNGDGKQDLLTWHHSLGWEIFHSTGIDFISVPLPPSVTSNIHSAGPLTCAINQTISTTITDPDRIYSIGDFDGNGRSDILELDNATSVRYYKIYYSFSNYDFRYETGTLPTAFQPMHLRAGDFNGDGQEDIMGTEEFGTAPNLYSQPAIIYFHPQDITDLVTSIEHAGRRLDIDIKSLAATTADPADEIEDYYGYVPWQEGTHTQTEYPYIAKQIPLKVVTSLKDNVSMYSTYYYETLSINLIGLGMQGFKKFKVRDFATQRKVETEFSMFPQAGFSFDYARSSFPAATTVYHFSDPVNPLSKTTYKYFDIPGDGTGKVRIFKNYGSIEVDYGKGIYHDTHIGFDFYSQMCTDFGVPDSIYEDYGVHNGYNNITTYFTYDATQAFYNRSKPIAITKAITYSAEPTYARTQHFSYNTEGLLAQKIEDPSQRNNTTDFTYDAFGNTLTSTLTYSKPGGGTATKLHKYEYSPDGRYLVKEINYNGTDPFTDIYDYNAWGKMIYHKENLLGTHYEYDPVNRLEKTIHPDDVTTRKAYDWAYNNTTGDNPPSSFSNYTVITNNPNAAQFFVKSTTDGITGENYEFVDFYGRTIRKAYPAFDGSTTYEDAQYYAMGNIATSTNAYAKLGGTPITTTYSYDIFGRETYRAPSAGPDFITDYETSVLPAYIKTTVTNNTTAQYKITYADPGGAYRVEDHGNNTIDYYYNSNGKPNKIIVNGNPALTTSFTYDDYGNVLTKTEPNTGTTSFKYNFLDQVTREDKPNGTQYKFTYDDFRNIKTKEDQNNNKYVYTYCPSWSTGAGKLQEERVQYQGNIAETKYSYDGYGRLDQITEMPDAGHSFVTKYSYNAWSQIWIHTYPSNLMVMHHYNQYGFLESKNTPTQNLWKITAKNSQGQLTNAEYYNSSGQPLYLMQKIFDPLGYLNQSRVYRSSGMSMTAIWAYDYDFDVNTGNLNSREDQLRSLHEDFTYDQLDRLTDVTSNTLVPAVNIKYSGEGNILRKSDVTSAPYDWQYDKYALKTVPDASIGPNFLSMIRQPNTQNTGYYPFDKVSNISEGPNYVDFAYGPNDQRVRVDFNSGQKVRYYANNYEETVENGVTTKISYIWGDDEPIAMVREVQGVPSVYYFVNDYLGSIMQVLDNQGAATNNGIAEERSYDAWGRPRDPNNWQYYPASTITQNWLTDRGYTGQEHIWLNGFDHAVINLNGRLYDPLIGRMFSPDPYVPDMSDPQCYNKYNYALNNPLKYNDPKGEWVHIAIGAVIGGVFNLGRELIRGKVHSFGDGLKAFGVGALAGGIGAATFGAGVALMTGAGVSAGLSGAVLGSGIGGFSAGAVAGSMSGIVSAPILTVGNALLLNDYDPNKSLIKQALQSAVWGGLFGAITGGIGNGILARINGRNFWNGKFPNVEKMSVVPTSLSNDPHPSDLTPNKLNHIFGKEEHNLDVLIKHFGDNETTMKEIYKELVKAGVPTEGTFDKILNVLGQEVTVRATWVNGQLRIGTMFIRFLK